MKKHLTIFFTLLVSFAFSQEVLALQKITLGVYQYQSKEAVEQQYQGLADYLNKSLSNYSIELKVFTQKDMLIALQKKQIQLLLVNPNLYEVLRAKVNLNGITATQQSNYNGQTLDKLGGVIFTKSSHINIKQLSDLLGYRIAIPSTNNTGAFTLPIYEFYKAGMDYKQLNFLPVGNNDAVVNAVLTDKADIGFVRTGILEKWFATHNLKKEDIKVIHPQVIANFPQLLSTELVPEWPFIILPGLDENVNRDIAVALFALRANNPAAKQAKLAGFVAPRDYLPFENILRTLNQPPYNVQSTITPSALWHQYKNKIIMSIVFILFIIGLLVLSEKRKGVISQQEKRLLKQNKIDEVLLEIPKYAETHSENELMQYALDKIEKLTLSTISFIYSVDSEKNQMQLLAWSRNAIEDDCSLTNYQLDKTGTLFKSIKKQRPIIINDHTQISHKAELLGCHTVFKNMIALPVVDHDQVVLAASAANKKTNYTSEDANVFQIILNEIWRILKANQANQEIIVQKNTYQMLLDDLGDNYMVFSHTGLDGILTYVSAGFNKVFEQPLEQALNTPWHSTINWLPESIKIGSDSIISLISGYKVEDNITLKFYSPSTLKIKTVLVHQHAVYHKNKLKSIDGLVTDITERVEAENRIKQAATVFESANEGIFICDEKNKILRANKQVEQITGYLEVELVGQDPKMLSSGLHDKSFYKRLWQSLLQNGSWEGELWNQRKNREIYPQRLKISLILDDNKNPAYFIGLISDITAEKEHQNQLEKMAHYDALTNLPNRFLLSDRITQAIHALQRNEEMIAIMFIDLDGFKLVNDTYGHQAGDFLLKTLAKRILHCIRETDTVARIGGDEFVVVISGTKDQHEFAMIEQRILTETSNPVEFEEHQLQVSSSIGVVYYGRNYGKDEGSEQLLRLADQAMYLAKQQGKNKVKHYEWDNMKSQSDLTHAFENGLFELHYQPKVNCKTGEILSLEGLIRLNHPEKGLIPPIEFLTDIEQFGLMDELSKFVIQEGVRYLNVLNKNQHSKIGISLNIQGNSLLHEEFITELLSLFNQNINLSPEQMTLEILETAFLDKVGNVAKQIMLLKEKGFKFSIDDFGTGYASLTYLKNLPVNEIKIDQEFIREMFTEPNSLSIIEAIKSMAEAFNLSVIAEGAETNEHIELLLQLGIESVQGYAIAKPMPESEMNLWINNWQANPYWQTLVEVSPKNKQLLKARLAHIAWINRFESSINQSIDGIIENSYLTCAFGVWFANEGKKILSPQMYQKINLIHQEVHRLAILIIESKKHTEEDRSEESTLKLIALIKQNSSELNSLLLAVENEE